METTLFGLPDELLLNIALRLNVSTLRNVAPTCPRLRFIAQEALVRTAALSPKHAWLLVDLLQQRPQIERLFTHIRLGRDESEDQYM